jgi:signal transduction histidine kinase
MSLLNKISIWFIAVVLLVTPISMYISYTSIKKRLDDAEIVRLKGVNNYIVAQLQRGETPEHSSQGLPIVVSKTDQPIPSQNPEITRSWHKPEGSDHNECLVRVNSYASVGGQVYKISSYNYVTKTDDILKGMMNAVVWKMLMIIAVVAITGRVLSRFILRPFRHAMQAIRGFSLQQREQLQLTPTSTREFKELNGFLQTMTDKAVADYASVKEFSENASHELQTPLAVIQSKIELLTETDINGGQAELIADMQNAIDKLSRINRSLTLLTRLDNHEFPTHEELRFCRVTREAIAAFADRMTLKNLRLSTHIDNSVLIKIHPALAEILVNNLLLNAIRHNVKDGAVTLTLTHQYLQISNTGLPPVIPTEELFQRFKKSNQSADSIGLGLSIVKQICTVSDFCVQYNFKNGWHTVTVQFCQTPMEELIPKHALLQPQTEPGSIQPAIS